MTKKELDKILNTFNIKVKDNMIFYNEISFITRLGSIIQQNENNYILEDNLYNLYNTFDEAYESLSKMVIRMKNTKMNSMLDNMKRDFV